MPLKRALTEIEKNIDFATYEKFLDKVKEQAIIELQKVIEDQRWVYSSKLKRILDTNETIAKKIKSIEILDIIFYKEFRNILKDYLDIVCLFSLKQASKELGIKNPKRLSPNINSWIKATSDIITIKYLAEIDLIVTTPAIDYIGRVTNQEIIYRVNLLFDDIKEKKPELIIRGLEGKALFVGRDLAVQIFNGDIKLEGFEFASISDIIKQEKVVAAQWSAILDAHICELCASLDGRTIDIDSPDYAFYSPGDIHLGCRCLWIYIKSTERPENRKINWKKPNAALLKTFAKLDIKQKRDVSIDKDDISK